MRRLKGPVVLGCDPGLAHFGVALVRLDEPKPVLVHAAVVVTEKEDRKAKVLEADDLVRRVSQLAQELRVHFNASMGDETANDPPRVLCVESMSYPRGASAAAKLATSWGVLVTLARGMGLPIQVASPQRVREALLGRRVVDGVRVKASKLDVELAVREQVEVDDALVSGIAKADLNHVWDAIAAAIACAKTSELIRSMR